MPSSPTVRVGGVNRIGDKSRLSATENFKLNMFSVLQFCPVSKSSVTTNRTCLQTRSHCRQNCSVSNILRTTETVGDCHQLCSHHRHDKTRQSCLVLVLGSLSVSGSSQFFHRITRTAYLYNKCLSWYNVVLTSRVHTSVKYSQQSQLRSRATVE